jgi:hypothetical protein
MGDVKRNWAQTVPIISHFAGKPGFWYLTGEDEQCGIIDSKKDLCCCPLLTPWHNYGKQQTKLDLIKEFLWQRKKKRNDG